MRNRLLQTLVLLLAALMVPTTAVAAFVQLAEGVYRNGSTLYIGSNVTSLGDLQVNPSVIYSFATVPPTCSANTFTGYGATLHMPPASYGAYFVNSVWGNFSTMYNDAIEPTGVMLSSTTASITVGETLTLTATVTPANASLRTVEWSSTNPSVATVSGGVVTAVDAGECDIVARCLNLQAVCHVTVTKTTIYITLDQHEARLLPNHSLTLTPTMSPMQTTLKVTVSNPEVAAARLVNGVVQVVGLAEGTTMIVVSSVDGQAVPDACMVTVYTEVGDLNSDGFVNINDVTTLINYLLSDNDTGISMFNADTNKDGFVNIGDVTSLINYLLTNDWPWDEYETFTVNGVSFRMVAVEGGTFMMGATAEQDSDAYDQEKPAHQVTLSSYNIGQTEVTQALWQAVMGSNPSYFSDFTGDLQLPVECVSWNDCQTFINKLNQMTGKNFRLPTEAEWEYAARGGKLNQGYKYAGSNTVDDVAWYRYNIPSQTTQPVATKAPNELVLYDMSGNVCEWCQDWYGNYTSDVQTNPTGPASGYYRVHRGGSWYIGSRGCRVSSRGSSGPAYADSRRGLRLALDDENSPKFRLLVTVVEIEKGRMATVDILNGSGSYSVAGATDFVTSTIAGETLNITGTALGTNTVQVTDNTTGATTVLTVIVKESNDETFTVNGVSFMMVAVEGGTFTMGATAEQGGDASDREKPAHQVTLSSYSIGQTEVTQALWQAVMDSNPSYFSPTNGYSLDLQRPVEQVSWNDCQAFISKLNQMTGKNFRLPTEAEWEYAARGGKWSQGYKYAGSNTVDDVAWYWYNSPSQTEGTEGYGTQPVATKAPNELFLYDMSGNVCEWCQDWYGSYTSDVQTNPTGPASGYWRVYRGGSGGDPWYCRVSSRDSSGPAYMTNGHGLRLALDDENSPKFRLLETVVEIEKGGMATVDILNGSGSYSIAGATDFVTSTIAGETLNITGTALGTNTVQVTDNTTGATTVLTVIVKESNGETITVNGVSFTMVAVEGGTFTMGATVEQGSDARPDEKPAHQVTLSSYSIGQTEVTQALWEAVMGSNPSYFSPTNGYSQNLLRPVEQVSWDDCQAFISKLNQMTGKNFRLPTEAEWEYAARGGKWSQGYKYAGSNTVDDVAWYYNNSFAFPEFSTHTVATKAPNELDLYDMSGNVCEWCQDWYGSYTSDVQTNPTGPASGSYRVHRGGTCRALDDNSWECRVSNRERARPTSAFGYLGLRLAL